MLVVGVDGRRSGWIAVALVDGRFGGAARFESFRALTRAVPDAMAIGVNLPLRLPAQERECDRWVREWVGSDIGGLVTGLPREALVAPSVDDVRQICLERSLPEPSERQLGLARKVLELERATVSEADVTDENWPSSSRWPSVTLGPAGSVAPSTRRALGVKDINTPIGLRRYARVVSRSSRGISRQRLRAGVALAAGRFFEVHPEAAFREMAGGALGADEDTEIGAKRRWQLLESVGIVLPPDADPIGRVSVDRLLRPTAVAWTARRYAQGDARSLPPHPAASGDAGTDYVPVIWV